MKTIDFTKMHGLGNDFVLMDLIEQAIPNDIPSLAQRICHRQRGVGADGLILILPAKKADLKMRIFNADGSEAEMCGNGIRCVAKMAYELGLVKTPHILVETLAGIIKPEIILGEQGQVVAVKVDMGVPHLLPEEVPVLMTGKRVIARPLEIGGQVLSINALSMGNPHCIIFVSDVAKASVQELGSIIENHPLFPAKTNVEFVEVINQDEVKMRVWERGAGETMACGTGACAALVASVLNNKTEQNILVHLKGGDLALSWGENNHVFMTGPAETVFKGQFYS